MSATVYLVGIGPGQPDLVTPEARAAIGKVSVVIGQPEWLALVQELTLDKEVIADRRSPLNARAWRWKRRRRDATWLSFPAATPASMPSPPPFWATSKTTTYLLT